MKKFFATLCVVAFSNGTIFAVPTQYPVSYETIPIQNGYTQQTVIREMPAQVINRTTVSEEIVVPPTVTQTTVVEKEMTTGTKVGLALFGTALIGGLIALAVVSANNDSPHFNGHGNMPPHQKDFKNRPSQSHRPNHR